MSKTDTINGIKDFSAKLRIIFGKDTFTEEELSKEFYTTLLITCGDYFKTDDAINLDLFWSETLKEYLLEPKKDGFPVSWNNQRNRIKPYNQGSALGVADKVKSSPNEFRFLIYKAENDQATAQVVIMDDTVWLTQKAMAELFDVEIPTINYHIKEIYVTHELNEDSTIRKILIVQPEGNRQVEREVIHYNLDVIISVGYRVNSLRATHFRMWATSVLREYMTKGFALDDERLKQGKTAFGKDYFRELLERVRSIRASERRIWQQVTDIYAECSIDYDKEAPTTKDFYAMVQNKFHYAITHKTAAEIVFDGADASKEHMGLQTWKHAPEGRILKSDAQIAKNYLDEKQISRLERTVSGYFDYIEDLIDRETVFTMQDFAASINEFLSFRRYDILQGKGRVSHAQALEKANSEYDAFNKTQRIESDFDKEIKKMLNESND